MFPTTRMLSAALVAASTAAACSPPGTPVEQHGAMRAVLREGLTEGRLPLTEAAAKAGAVGVGALEGLQGEITILDGNVWVARPLGSRLDVTGPRPVAGDQATLLTLASVDRWRTVPLAEGPAAEPFEATLERTARAHGVDTTQPFPFVVDGAARQLAIHVINGFCPMATDAATIGAEPWRWASEAAVEATIVGFFAPDAPGVMTHHGSSIHAHALLTLDGTTVTGHVDRFAAAPGATLRLPAAP